MRITVNVTADDIELGEPDNCHACPIARALVREHGGRPWVRYRTLEFGRREKGGTVYVWRAGTMPPEAGEFAKRFDRKEPVEPFSFEIDLEDVK